MLEAFDEMDIRVLKKLLKGTPLDIIAKQLRLERKIVEDKINAWMQEFKKRSRPSDLLKSMGILDGLTFRLDDFSKHIPINRHLWQNYRPRERYVTYISTAASRRVECQLTKVDSSKVMDYAGFRKVSVSFEIRQCPRCPKTSRIVHTMTAGLRDKLSGTVVVTCRAAAHEFILKKDMTTMWDVLPRD